MRTVEACPACDAVGRTLVCEFNGLVLLNSMRESPLCRYDYSLCHGCGLVYATRRPEGEELAYLYSRFDEVLGRDEDDQTAGRTTEVSAAEEAEMRARLARGWLVSEEGGPGDHEWMADVFDERVLNSFHVNLVGALVPLAGRRVLELRATTGFMLNVLRERYGAAEIFAMPMSERHRIIIDALNPMPMAVVDFDRLDVPFDGTFDLILARHMITHALEPQRLWQLFRERLNPGGYVYLFLENDDRAMLHDKRKNLIGEQKAFHFQNVDLLVLARILRHHGLDPVFIRHPRPGRSEMVCLARRDDRVAGAPIPPAEFESRLEFYQRWRDLSVMSLAPDLQALFALELETIRGRALAGGYGIEKGGRVVPKKALRMMHQAGYERLNEAGSHAS